MTEKWQMIPTPIPRGARATSRKSRIVIWVPIPNMTSWITIRKSALLPRSKVPQCVNQSGRVRPATTVATIRAVNS